MPAPDSGTQNDTIAELGATHQISVEFSKSVEQDRLDRFVKLVRSPKDPLPAYLGVTETSVNLEGTRATVHSRHLLHDGNNLPRVKDLAERLVHEIIDYCIPRTEIHKAETEFSIDNSTRHFSRLHERSRRLFSDIANSGEGGELLLFLLAEGHLQLPQLLCKMPLKTSSQVHFHGSDGIYGAYNADSDTLALYWGESKLYDNAAAAIAKCIESLKEFVLPAGGSQAPQRRDLELVSDNLKLNDPELERAILRYLNPDDPFYNKLEYRGVALVGFDSKHYPEAGGACLMSDVVKQLNRSIKGWHKSASTHIAKHSLAKVHIDLFCLPFPSVQQFRDALLEELGLK